LGQAVRRFGLGSVLDWDPLYVVDHQHFHLPIARLQPQPKRDSGEDVGRWSRLPDDFFNYSILRLVWN
jgi:hypothetical protein